MQISKSLSLRFIAHMPIDIYRSGINREVGECKRCITTSVIFVFTCINVEIGFTAFTFGIYIIPTFNYFQMLVNCLLLHCTVFI
jgi:hypothetical protein